MALKITLEASIVFNQIFAEVFPEFSLNKLQEVIIVIFHITSFYILPTCSPATLKYHNEASINDGTFFKRFLTPLPLVAFRHVL